MSDPYDSVPHPRRAAATVLLAAASLGAAAIHLAAGPAHVEELGDVGLAFYWTAMLQIALGLGFVRAGKAGPGRVLTRVALVGSLGVTAVWAISRTVGLPFMDGAAESVGIADLVATILQVATVITLLVIRPRPSEAAATTPTIRVRPVAPASMAARAGLVAAVAMIALSATIGVADATASHGDGHGHAPGVTEDHAHVPTREPASDALDHHPADEVDGHGHGEAPRP